MQNLKTRTADFSSKAKRTASRVVDDYGHHPTEITATLSAAKEGSGGRRTVVVFQPHRYTRTNELMEDFARCFNNADVLYLLDIYAASEPPIENVTAEILAEKINEFGHKNVHYIGDIETAAEKVTENLQPGDLVITLGAGSITRLSDEILEVLKQMTIAKTGNGSQNNYGDRESNARRREKRADTEIEKRFGRADKFFRAAFFYRRHFILSRIFIVYGLSNGDGFGVFRC